MALAALPVLLGGLGLVVVAGGIDPLDPFIPAAEESPIRPTPSPAPASGDESADSGSGTPIDGRRPHLSVIDGRTNLVVPAPLPAILSLLPGTAADLSPLPPSRDGHDAPGVHNTPSPRNQPDALPPAPAVPPVGRGQSAPPPWTPEVPVGPQPAVDPLPPRMVGDPRFDRDDPSWITGGNMNQGPPPHAGAQGPPPHAGQTGPPEHAASVNRFEHADHSGPPDHAGWGAQKPDDSRPGPR